MPERRGRQRDATDGRLLATLTWTLAALAIGCAPHSVHLPIWVWAMVAGCAAWRWTIERRRGHLPPRALRRALALAAFLAVLGVYRSINGIAPGTALLAVMAALKLLETRERRDLFVVLFIALFLVLATLLREQHIWSAVYLVVALATITASWINVGRYGAVLPATLVIRAALRLIAQAAPLMLVFWVLFPRLAGSFWAVPAQQTQASTGISEHMSPGDISKLSRSDAAAFRVRFDAAPPASADLYWRGPVLTEFNGRSWNGSKTGFTSNADRPIQTSGAPTHYSITLEPTHQSWLFALDIPIRWSASAFMGPGQQLQLHRDSLTKRISYDATSYTNFKILSKLPAPARSEYTRLGNPANPRTIALARELHAAAGDDDRAFIQRVLALFREQEFYYTLEPPPLGRNPVDEFLFSTRRGFCEHYASAFALLARAAGIPARVVVGYQGGEPNPLSDYFLVRQSNAHAWTEVWLTDDGWVRVDPTAAVSALRIEAGLSAALNEIGEGRSRFLLDSFLFRQIGFSWDAVRARWEDWVLGYGPEAQRNFLRWFGIDNPRVSHLIGLLALMTGAVLGVLAFGLARNFRQPDPDPALKQYRRLRSVLGTAPPEAESPYRFAARVRSEYPALATQVREAIEEYLSLRYANRGSIDALEHNVDRIIRLARRELATTATPR